MGRWSQSRHRGRCRTNPPAFPLAPPDGALWEATNGAVGELLVDLISGTCVLGADGFDVGYAIDPGVPPADGFLGEGCGDTFDQFFGSGVPINFAIRWTLGGVAVSDWSAIKQITA